jgi:hypothetical protein
MRIKALWYGGSNYSNPDPERDLESFDSIAYAKLAFESRAGFDPYYPCVEGSEMHLYFGEYSENGPDRILTLGPRGAVRMTRA